MNHAHPDPLTARDALVLAILVSPVLALCVWGIARMRRARAEIRQSLRAAGFEIVQLKQQFLRFGPFTWWSRRSYVIFRVIVRDREGRARIVWARWGRVWLFSPDTLELRWDD